MNRLSDSSSLYLQQHAENPVNWNPWDSAALADARNRNVPILLSIGYSSCHWCHVMAHESFEDATIAGLMNDLYVNIKVDREERPDLDKIYQLTHQLLNGRGGGWPLTVFLHPADLTPFYAGTYFPPKPQHGMPSFADVLRNLRDWFDSHQDEIKRQNINLREAVRAIQAVAKDSDMPDDKPLLAAIESARQQYDAEHGGFGGAPKFPQAPLLSFISSICDVPKFRKDMQEVLHDSLQKMAVSGLWDHLDGGFFRYTVDGTWTIPHFEKMLYDNAQLLPLYASAALRLRLAGDKDRNFAQVAIGIADWLDASMASIEGGYCASIDADADGIEGGFHVWERQQVRELLSADQYRCFSPAYGLNQPANFEQRAWHLTRQHDSRTQPEDGVLSADEIKNLLAQSRRILATRRNQRIHPVTDPKRLTGWNALLVDGLVRAGAALDKPAWIKKAEQVLDLLRQQMWSDGQLFMLRSVGQSQQKSCLDDYAWLLQAALSVLREHWQHRHYQFALQLADTILEKFMDQEHGGFFYTAAGEQTPIHRIRPDQDDATPAATGCATRALLQLGHLSGNALYLQAAHTSLEVSARALYKYPLAHTSLLMALHDDIRQPVQVIVTGTNHEKTTRFHQALHLMDGVHCYTLGPDETVPPGSVGTIDGSSEAVAYICRDRHCLPPVDSLEAVLQLLSDSH